MAQVRVGVFSSSVKHSHGTQWYLQVISAAQTDVFQILIGDEGLCELLQIFLIKPKDMPPTQELYWRT